MEQKTMVMLGLTIGSAIGGYVPILFGADFFSPWAIVTTAIGGALGVWIMFKLTS